MKNAQRGFTIIELLLALSILTSISIFAITMIGNQIDTRNKLTRSNDAMHAIDNAMSKVFDDLRHAYIIPLADATTSNLEMRAVKPALVWRPVGEEGAFYFSTQNYRSVLANTPQSNLSMVAYLKRREKDGPRMQLVRRVDLDFNDSIDRPGVGHEDVLLPDLKEFKILFWDGTEFKREDWDTTSGDTANKLPKMAKIRISAFLPLTEQEKQKQENGEMSSLDRPSTTLETIVYFMYSVGQADIKEPGKEYKWQ